MKYGSIATGSKESLNTAKNILKEGGNAFDAGIAAVFSSMISEFALTGAGGGGVLMGMEKGQEPIAYDFFVDCPIGKINDIDFKKINVNFGNTSQGFHIGKGSTAVPGTIAGLLDIHQEKGILPLSVILEPAIKLSKEGIVLSKYQSYINSLIEPILTNSKTGKELFIKNNQFLKTGDTFKNPNFAYFLEMLIKNGKDFFYRGEGAELITKLYSKQGYLNQENLNNYKVYKRKALKIDIGEYQIFTNPAPAYGGTLMAFFLDLLKKSNSLNTDYIKLIKAMELTSMARNEVCQNPDNEMEISNCFNPDIFNKYLHLFNDDDFIGDTTALSGFGSTTHLSIIDKNQNVVSVTTTNGEGSGIFIPEFGILMNNMLGEKDLNPFGFHKWNKQRRLPTMLCPTIILKNNIPVYAIGSGGSNRIRSAISQVIINLIIKQMSLKESIESPRIHLEGKKLFIEPNIKLDKHLYLNHLDINLFKQKNLFFGGVNCASLNDAIGDSRRGGVGQVI